MSTTDIPKCKCIIVGNSGAGKTCIAQKLVFDTFSGNIMTTIGVSSFTHKITVDDSVELKMDIWDTVGQERYASMNNQFFNGAHIAILTYDITCRESFENLERRWIKDVKQYGGENLSKLLIYINT